MSVRNDFYINYENGGFGHAEIKTRKKIANLIDDIFPNIIEKSKCGWKVINDGKKEVLLEIDYNYKNRQDVELLKKLREWISASKKLKWRFYPNEKFSNCLDGSELECCVSYDLNIYPHILNESNDSPDKYTNIGLAVHRLKNKSPSQYIHPQDEDDFKIVINGMKKCLECLPICYNDAYTKDSVIVTMVPYRKGRQEKLDSILSKQFASELDVRFLETTFLEQKQETKKLSIEDKLKSWTNVYKPGNICTEVYSTLHYPDTLEKNLLEGKNYLIIDDLYQSGTSVWTYAKFLKHVCGAQKVFAITAVKALGDNDNTHNEFIAEVSGFE